VDTHDDAASAAAAQVIAILRTPFAETMKDNAVRARRRHRGRRRAWHACCSVNGNVVQAIEESTMQKILSLGLALLPLAGCAVSTGADPTGARLPTGVTLLESDRNTCAGVVHVDEHSVSSTREIVVRPGQNASFRVGGEQIQWTCIGEANADDDRLQCPDRTTYVRITRPAAGQDFLVECYG
jgi:hypothetical protein